MIRGSTVVVKLGGELLAEPDVADGIARELAHSRRRGTRVCVVHGGGPQATELQRALGTEPRLVGGRRITDSATIEVAKMTFAGKLNTELVAALLRHGVQAVGLTGLDGALLRVHRRPPVPVAATPDAEVVDFGFVGDVDGVDATLVRHLMGHGFVPVICSLAATSDGTVLNVNADTIAAEVAVALRAVALVVLTAVPGVHREFGVTTETWSALTADEAHRLVADGAVGGGMAPKLAACGAAVERGVARAVIVDGRDPEALQSALAGAPGRGTAVTRIAGVDAAAG